jgi:hypothetical protein
LLLSTGRPATREIEHGRHFLGLPNRAIGIFGRLDCIGACDIGSKIAVRTARVTRLTRTPVSASSLPSDRVDATAAALLARQARGRGRRVGAGIGIAVLATGAVLTMRP